MDEMDGRACDSKGCGKPAKLRCPTCIKMGLRDSFFCDQTCFKTNWSFHKLVHTDLSAPYNPWPHYRFSGLLRPARLSPRRDVPLNIPRPDYALHPEGISFEERQAKNNRDIKVLDDEEKDGLRLACKLGREVLNEAANACAPGVTTDDIDRVVHEACIERNCYPSPLGYYKFPKSCCTSVNEVICHGIPDLRILKNGDLCNVDVTVYHRGFHGDLNETFLVGDKVDPESRKLVQTTYECLEQAIAMGKRHLFCSIRVYFILFFSEKHANSKGFSVVKAYCGHGIHRLFHTVPNVPHYAM
uniref:Methionine aminopeptidase n=1 Tax=Heterorhabditis bacteriophora TaxID=37862 RepID=A0A1I7WSN1_HETBA